MNTLWFKAKNMPAGSKFLAGNGSFIYPLLAYSMYPPGLPPAAVKVRFNLLF
jgi:hypothetical protein